MNQEESKKRFQNFTAQRSAVSLIECSQCDTESDPSPSLKRFLNQDCFVALHGSARRLSFFHKTIQHCRACVKVIQNRHININIQIIANCLSLSTDFNRLYAEINLSQFAECGLQTKMRLKTVANGLVALSAVHRCFKTSRAHLGLCLQVSLLTLAQIFSSI